MLGVGWGRDTLGMKLRARGETNEAVHEVAVALTLKEAWDLRVSLSNMLGLETSGSMPDEWPEVVASEAGWHEHVSSADYQLDIQVRPDLG